MRGVKNFAYDLDMIPGAVNSRVVLLLRSIEAKPWHLILFSREISLRLLLPAGFLKGLLVAGPSSSLAPAFKSSRVAELCERSTWPAR